MLPVLWQIKPAGFFMTFVGLHLELSNITHKQWQAKK
jgi:hypothetical protein